MHRQRDQPGNPSATRQCVLLTTVGALALPVEARQTMV
jgi:hypothetical protein